ncbi:hypothetical protein ACHAWF_003466, partial [Thalassiosira exigua]
RGYSLFTTRYHPFWGSTDASPGNGEYYQSDSRDLVAAKIFFIQRHLGVDDVAGQMMRQAYEAFLMEVGLYGDVVSLDFEAYGDLVNTDLTWFKYVWEYANILRVGINLSDDFQIQPVQHQGDLSLVESFRRVGYEGTELERLNRVRKYKCIVHLSNIVCCDGLTLECGLLGYSAAGYSCHKFPLEQPTRADFQLWDQAVGHLFLRSGRLERPLGPFVHESHLFQHWSLSEDATKLYYRAFGDVLETYGEYSLEPGRHSTRGGQRCRKSGTFTGCPPLEHCASVVYEDGSDISVTRPFLEILHSFENQSLWKYFHCDGDSEWI